MNNSWRNTESRKRNYLPLLKEGAVLCFFDTETTGLESKDKIIQFSAIKYVIHNNALTYVSTLELYINPEHNLDKKITELTGITDEMLSDKPAENEISNVICDYLSDSDVWVAYNSSFDITMINNMARRTNQMLINKPDIDVLELARDFCNIENHKLQSVYRHLMGDESEYSFHNAMDDIKATAKILVILIEELRNYEEKEGDMITHLEKAFLYRNKYKKEVRINMVLSEGEDGAIYYSLFDHVWKSKADKESRNLFKIINMRNLESQFLEKYGYRFGHNSMDDVGFSWLNYKKKK